MHDSGKYWSRPGIYSLVWGVLLFLLAGFPVLSHAADYQNLPVVKPVVSCDQLAKADLSQAVGAAVTIKSATEIDTAKGKYCKVTGTIAPAVGFEVDLPMEHWTQRYLEAGCGGMCGDVRASIGNAGSCMPALNGEFVVAADDMGHSGGMSGPGGGGDGPSAPIPTRASTSPIAPITRQRWRPRR